MEATIGSGRSVRGRVALVTGAASGMGAATVAVFAADGARVAACDIDGDGAGRVARDARDAGGDAEAFAVDLADGEQIGDLVGRVTARFGRLDILVNNAGISVRCPIDAPDYDDRWAQGLAVLLSAQQRLIRAALPWLRRSDAARIVNIASTEALGATAGLSVYSAAKAGVTGLSRSLAVELGRDAITVNCICPGPIETAMTAAISAEHKAVFARRRTALGRYGRPEEVAHITLSLCLPAASYLTGAVIPVDGGLMARNA
ncbi:MAG: SDR family NAD(P)-dependent oxidoreductase [Burkholderiaceae bacterium]